MNRHIFALFYPELSSKTLPLKEGDLFSIVSVDLMSRIRNVLRLSRGDQCIFFDSLIAVKSSIDVLTKKEIRCTAISITPHFRKGTHVTVLLPLLKKDDFDTSLYALGAVGVDTIQLVVTDKTQRTWNKDKDRVRSQNILIAAAEQSKYFSMPTIYDPQPLLNVLDDYSSTLSTKIVADPLGDPIQHLFASHVSYQKIVMLVGPEGGLTEREIAHTSRAGFIPYQLTPTILKAEHAVIIMSGLLRSIVVKN